MAPKLWYVYSCFDNVLREIIPAVKFLTKIYTVNFINYTVIYKQEMRPLGTVCEKSQNREFEKTLKRKKIRHKIRHRNGNTKSHIRTSRT